jgi:hypothetical protein
MLKVSGGIAVALTIAGTAQAQTSRLHLGPRISYQFDAEDIGLGAQLGVPVARQLEFYPSFDIFFVDPGSLWQFNADLKYRFGGQGLDWLYAGAGLNLLHASAGGASNTDAGLNLFGGIESLKGTVHPFAELRLTVGDGSTGMIAGGLNFTLGRHR